MWRLRVVHDTGYAYQSPVTASYNEARLTPRSDSRQNVILNRVETVPATRSYRYVDYWGTTVTAFDLHAPHTELTVSSSSVVETDRPRQYETALELERVLGEKLGPKGIYPNVDFFSGIVYQALGIPRDLFTPIFAIARVAGWLAHWLEQLQNNRIFRPEQVFVGKHDREYAPLEKRA